MGLSSSEELDIFSIKASDLYDSSAHSLRYEELVEVITRTMVKLNIDWPAKKWEAQKRVSLMRSPTSRLAVLSLRKPYSSRISSPTVHNYIIVGFKVYF